ncbi:MAG: SMC-Scp complex subunit ScpB [Alphaproteobacteria bacterium]
MPVDAPTLRLVEAILFAAVEPLDEASIAARLPENSDVPALLAELQAQYAERGVNLVRVARKWALRTAPDLADRLQIEREATRKLSRAAIETLAIIAYHQPITRAEVENIRGVAVNRGTLDVLLEAGWIKPGRRRDVPGRPVTWLTAEAFLDHFGLESLKDLPGVKELKAAGLLDTRPAINVYSERAGSDDGDLDDGDTPDAEAGQTVEPLLEEDAPAA